MDDHELREMIRDSIAHQLDARPAGGGSTPMGPAFRTHASHVLLPLARGADADEGVCVIEPAVRCNHCGFCVSFGH